MSEDDLHTADGERLQGRLIGHEAGEAEIMAAMARRAFTGGWIVSGPDGVGKTSLALRVAAAMLGPFRTKTADPAADRASSGPSVDGELFGATDGTAGLDARRNDAAARLIAAGAHPDLFIARPVVNEKTGREATEISIETIRRLTQFMSLTPSMGDVRLAIIDTADQLNRNAANALLKVLEEPPPGAALILLSASPGRLLATIRSRCRRVTLKPVAADRLAVFVRDRTGAEAAAAERIAAAAKGRPGYALTLGDGDGRTALDLVDALFAGSSQTDALASALTARGADGVWRYFAEILFDRLDALILAHVENRGAEKASQAAVETALKTREEIMHLIGSADAVNLDRAQVAHALGRRLHPLLTARRS